ncbi:MAG TPA: DUF4198 domain-containing protein [Longimicrobiaceae bacterium]|nr:DUF4198 domain-containing protein [Longimicrobiaceae bacterium]
MKRKPFVLAAVLLLCATSLLAHDLFLRPDSFFLRQGEAVRVRVLNGTFTASEGAVARGRLRDLSLAGPEGRTQLDTTVWDARGDTSMLRVRAATAGTYVLGASLLPRTIRLEAADFNRYLEEDGIPDVLAARRRAGELGRPARERYSKHVKALLQAGERRTDSYATVLGYAAELVPLDNPYRLGVGGVLRVRALVDGSPAAGLTVLSGGRTSAGARIAERAARTDAAGIARIPLRSRGAWYVKFIRMVPVQGDSVDYESKWATLTFGVR